ncbi:hypothetical protein Droror1_Dr00002483 [Drosera rotundifolia]
MVQERVEDLEDEWILDDIEIDMGRRSGYTTQRSRVQGRRSGYTTQRSGVQGRRRREMSDGDVKEKKDEGNEDGRVKSVGDASACYDDGLMGDWESGVLG